MSRTGSKGRKAVSRTGASEAQNEDGRLDVAERLASIANQQQHQASGECKHVAVQHSFDGPRDTFAQETKTDISSGPDRDTWPNSSKQPEDPVFAAERVAANSGRPNGANSHVAIDDVSWQHRNPFTQQLPVEPTTYTPATPSREREDCQPLAAGADDSQPSMHMMPAAPATSQAQPPPHHPPPAGDSPIATQVSEQREHPEAGAEATGGAAQLGRGRRTRKLTTKMAAAGADGAATVARAPPQPAPPRAKAAKRARNDSPDRDPSPDGNSDTTAAFLRQPTPPAAIATASTSAVLRMKRARKGNPVRASE